ncbi:MAG TPA: GYD domain-containing protein [Dehalococcoidia bacterium]|jgi:uncharacterized protein with GYD domain
MATYIILGKYTEQGIRNIKQSPQRVDQVRAAVEAAGGKMPGFYLTMGQYDFVAITEGPDDEAITRVLLSVVSSGNVSTETLKAFPEADYRRIIASLP